MSALCQTCISLLYVQCSARFDTPHKIHGGVIYSKFTCHILHPLPYSTPPAIFYTPWWISLQLLYYEVSEVQQLLTGATVAEW